MIVIMTMMIIIMSTTRVSRATLIGGENGITRPSDYYYERTRSQAVPKNLSLTGFRTPKKDRKKKTGLFFFPVYFV